MWFGFLFHGKISSMLPYPWKNFHDLGSSSNLTFFWLKLWSFAQGKASSMVAAALDPKPGWEVSNASHLYWWMMIEFFTQGIDLSYLSLALVLICWWNPSLTVYIQIRNPQLQFSSAFFFSFSISIEKPWNT